MSAPREYRAGRMLIWQLLLGTTVLAVWEALARSGKLDPFFFSRPGAIGERIVAWFRSGSIWPHLAATLEEAALAFLIGAAAGASAGFALARIPWLGALLDPYIRVLNALPRVVLAPIFLLWFGLGVWSKVALGVTV